MTYKKRVCQNTNGLCHSERSEESVNISRKYKAHVIRFFTSFRMTRDRQKTSKQTSE